MNVEAIMIGGRKQLTMGGTPRDKMSLGRSWISVLQQQ